MSTAAEQLRKAARELFWASGLGYGNVTPDSMRRLRSLVNERMKCSGLMLGTYRCRQRGIVKETASGRYGELRCRADYFDDREAITFNTDKFIGFAGWADDQNVRPIVDGFTAWVRELAESASNENGQRGSEA